MEEKGWRGFIYDAPWATFESGQTGVIISEDGKECETLIDDIRSIKISVDPNVSFEDRTSGHILFRQKGSDLFDIVCIYQQPGGSYELKIVSENDIDGCNYDFEQKWSDFINSLSIYEIVNDNIESLDNLSFAKKEALIKSPTKSAAHDRNLLVNEGDSPKTVNVLAVKSYNDEGRIFASAATTVVVQPSGNEVSSFTNSTFDLRALNFTVETTSSSSQQAPCKIKAVDGSTSMSCGGGTVYFVRDTTESNCEITFITATTDEQTCKITARFVANESQVTKNYIISGLTNATVTHRYLVTKCNQSMRFVTAPGVISKWDIIEPSLDSGKITVTIQDHEKIIFTVDPSVHIVIIQATSDKGTTSSKEFAF